MGIRYRMLNGKPVILEDTNTGYVRPKDSNTHTHEDGTTHDHEDGDKPHHHHEDGTF